MRHMMSLKYAARDNALDALMLAAITLLHEERHHGPRMVAAEEAREEAIEAFVKAHAALVEYEAHAVT